MVRLLKPPGLEVGWRGSDGVGGAATRGRILRVPSKEKRNPRGRDGFRLELAQMGSGQARARTRVRLGPGFFSKSLGLSPSQSLKIIFKPSLDRGRARLSLTLFHRSP